MPPLLIGEALAVDFSFIYPPEAPLLGKTPPVGGDGTFVPEGERLSSECETERLIIVDYK